MTRIGYVLKVYPRFSETFVVTEILAREAAGDDLAIYALRPTTDQRFHPEIARVKAPVTWVRRYPKGADLWDRIASGVRHPVIAEQLPGLLPELAGLPGDEVGQGIELAEAALADGITHLHAHFASLAGRMAWVASRLTGVPYTLTTHAKDIYHASVDPVLLRRICADADRVIAISRFNENHLGRVLAGTGARVVLQYNALELARFPFREPAPAHQPLRIAAVGRLVEKKGFAYLIDAAALLVAQGRQLDVRIAGSGELADDLAHRVKAAGLEGTVRLVGPQPQDRIRALVEWADVFAAPCIPGEDGNIDGLPTVVLEAMALGTPVIATAVTGLPEVVENGRTGVLLAPRDLDGLASALADFADGRQPAAQFAAQARALIEERFDSRKQARTLSTWQRSQPAAREAVVA